MSEHLDKTIEDLREEIRKHEEKANSLKITVNHLCEMAKRAPLYVIASVDANERRLNIRSDQYYGRPLATVVEEYLEMRRSADEGPATIPEIFEALIQGGYEFNTKNDQMSRTSLNSSLSKNPKFHKLPNKRWGLIGWYPKAKKAKDVDSGEERRNAETADQGEEIDSNASEK